jgi:hypothetical protein
MADILHFQSSRARDIPSGRAPDDASYSFWPEVECGLWHREADAANAPKRVGLEIALILGATAILCLLTNLLSAPTLQ